MHSKTFDLTHVTAALTGLVLDADGHPLTQRAAAEEAIRFDLVIVHNGGDLATTLLSVQAQGHHRVGSCTILANAPPPEDFNPGLAVEWIVCPTSGAGAYLSTALSRGDQEACGLLISGDRYLPTALDRVAEALSSRPEVQWLSGRASLWLGNTVQDVLRHSCFNINDHLWLEGGVPLQAASVFWRRNIWRHATTRYPDNSGPAWQYALWFALLDSAPLFMLDALLGATAAHNANATSFGDVATRAAIAPLRSHLPPPTPLSQLAAGIELITSLVPSQLSVQLPAVRSWQRLGFKVTSLNTAGERQAMAGVYPGVDFVNVERSGQGRIGKPCVYFDDVMAHCRSSRYERFGLINADIHLYGDASLVELIAQESRGALVYGARYEVQSPHSATGWQFWLGNDFFFFDRGLLGLYPKSDFMLGVTWWDYWAPLLPAAKGYPVKHLDSPIAYHVSHPINYDQAQLYEFGAHFAKLLGDLPPVQLHRQFLRMMDQLYPENRPHKDIAMLAVASRYAIRRAATVLRWTAPQADQLGCIFAKRPSQCYRITAVVSTYASEAHIAECLDDLLGQTIADQIEIFVLDAASPQNEGAVVERYQQHHANIRYLRTPQRIGVYAAWNAIGREASGEYLLSASTNDRLAPDACELLSRALDEHPGIGLAFGSSFLTRQPHQTLDRFDFAGTYIWQSDTSLNSLLRSPTVGPHAMWRRALHDEIGYFDERYNAIADQDFWLRIAARYPVFNIHEVTGLYLLSDDSLSGNRSRAQSEYRQIVESHRREYAYRQWREGRYFSAGMARRVDTALAEWTDKPHFTLFIRHTQTNLKGLSATINSLTPQLYDAFSVIVLSPIAAPPGVNGERLAWHSCATEHWAQSLNQLTSGLPLHHTNWLAVLQDGDCLPERALLMLAQAIHLHPNWQVIYVDEDELDATGEHRTPHFKPAFDPDHALAAPYPGDILFFHADRFIALGGLAPGLPGAEAFDLLLRTQEASGATAIGHVADILLSRPAGRWSPYPQHSHAQAVAGHLGRQGIQASLQFNEGRPLRIDFQVPDGAPAPSVALLVYPASYQLAALEQAITSLLEKTPQQPFTLYVLDPGPRHADIHRFLEQLDSLGMPNLVCLSPSADANLTQTLGTLLSTLCEDYVVLWSDDTVAVQSDWLTPLLGQFNRPTGPLAVGPRLANAAGQLVSAGQIAGLCGPTGAPYKGVFLDYPGENIWLQSDHRAAALDPRCLLVHRSALVTSEILDIPGATATEWSTELCLKLASRGPLLWTPAATVMVRESLEHLEQDDEARRKTGPDDAERATLLRWRTHIVEQAKGQPHLNMEARDLIPDSRSALTYTPLPSLALPRVYAHVADREGCGHYRILQPLEALLTEALISGGAATDPLPASRMVADEFDTWIFQRPHSPTMLQAMRNYRDLSSALRIFEVDDLITEIPPDNPHAKQFGPQALALFRQAISLCDRLVVPTEALAQAYGHLASEVRVVPNYLPRQIWGALNPAPRVSSRPRVGWAGSASHHGDLAILLDIVKTLSNEVDWIFFGTCRAELRPYAHKIVPPVSFRHYPSALAQLSLDLALAPIADNAFNAAKSNLKLLEYGTLGYPVICSDIGPYRQSDFPVQRVANNAKAWISAIRERIHDLDATRREGQTLQAYVQRHWMLDDHLDEWNAAWTR